MLHFGDFDKNNQNCYTLMSNARIISDSFLPNPPIMAESQAAGAKTINSNIGHLIQGNLLCDSNTIKKVCVRPIHALALGFLSELQ